MSADGLELLECARYGEEDGVEAQLSAGVPVDFADDNGNTALHKCCANGHLAVAEVLIKAGAKHFGNSNGNNPLQWAMQGKHLEVIKLLLSKFPGIDVLEKNEFGKSLVSAAIGGGDVAMTQLILEHPSAAPLEDAKAVDETALTKAINGEEEEKESSGCSHCGAELSDPKRCTKCKSVRYCNRECQVADWPKHKKQCKKLAAAAAGGGGESGGTSSGGGNSNGGSGGRSNDGSGIAASLGAVSVSGGSQDMDMD
jgi:hypothetical protein